MSRLGELLLELEARWRAHGWSGEPALGAPLDREVVAAKLAEAGLRPAEELLDWFGWHNGSAREEPGHRATLGPVNAFVATLDMCLEGRAEAIAQAEAEAAIYRESGDTDELSLYFADPENEWSRAWLLILPEFHAVSVPETGPVLMFAWSPEDAMPPEDRAMYPMVEVIESWVNAMVDTEWDPTIQRWRYSPGVAPGPLLY